MTLIIISVGIILTIIGGLYLLGVLSSFEKIILDGLKNAQILMIIVDLEYPSLCDRFQRCPFMVKSKKGAMNCHLFGEKKLLTELFPVRVSVLINGKVVTFYKITDTCSAVQKKLEE
jgi:hypothetical protein